MKIPRWFATLSFVVAIIAFVGFSPSKAVADAILDPGVRLCCGGGSTDLTSPTDPNFVINAFGGFNNQTFSFINDTGQTAIGVNLVLTAETRNDVPVSPFDLSFTCSTAGQQYFTTCTPETPTQTTLISFFGLDPELGFNGIPTAAPGTVSCDGPTACSYTGPPGTAEFTVVVNAGDILSGNNFTLTGTLLVPEPSTILLVIVGVLFVFVLGRVRGLVRWVPKLS